ncbi:hypothetical protein KHP62_18170 [Rhodobacteraceae bacterium NNCM2]|nr:hypothetical protein [Coraliihabitans acroporae]
MYVIVLRLVILFAILSVVYIALGAYSRYEERKRLQSEHSAGAGGGVSREDYVQKGLADYERSWRKKLLYGVFIFPLAAAIILILIANYS